MMVRRGRERDIGKERFWRDVIRRHRQSGQTIGEFCLAHDLSESNFHSWRRTIAERDRRTDPIAPPAFVPLRVMSAAEIPTAERPTASPLEVVVGANRVIRVSPGFDAATLRHLLAALEENPSC